jgi:autotransporter-associated beta strand protein
MKPIRDIRKLAFHRPRLSVLIATAIIVLNSSVTKAATSYYWRVASGSWSTASNWGGTTLPTSSDYACIQNSGTATIDKYARCDTLYLGGPVSGAVELISGGELMANRERIGEGSLTTGTFTQNGGVNIVGGGFQGGLYLGYSANYTGIYNLSGTGVLSCWSDEYIGHSGTGTFTQTGGTNTILSGISYLYLGYNANSNGTYNLSDAGQLSTDRESIGHSGTGIFTQTGGTNTITSFLYLGMNPGSSGTYNLNGGTLIAKQISKGSGTASFNFGGGTLRASGDILGSPPMNLTGIGGNANIDTAGYTIDIGKALSGVGGLNKIGAGTLHLWGQNPISYSGNTTVYGGTLEIANGIDPSGTSLIDVQSGKAVLKSVNINKANLDISTAPSAIFEVYNKTHLVDEIIGSGLTQVDTDAILSAASIHQGTLTIAAGAKVVIRPLPGGPLSGAITSVPEPSAFVLLAGAVMLLIAHWARTRNG